MKALKIPTITLITPLLIVLLLLMDYSTYGQDHLKIKDNNGTVLLEARETGVMIRKMTTAYRQSVSGLTTADNGLLVYDIDARSLWMWRDTAWLELDGTDMVNDADHDPMNETNSSFVLTDSLLHLTDSAGTLSVDLSDLINDADHDPFNEVNTALVFNDSILSITDSAGTLSVDLSSLLNDADYDTLNEINKAMVLNDSVLELTDNGGMLSVDFSHLLGDGRWEMDSNKVYNASADVGVGAPDPQARMHVSDSLGTGEHVMLIENRNHEGSGLKIKIDGSHPLFVKGQGGAPDLFITHPGKAALAAFDSMTADIRTYIMNNDLDLSDFTYADIGTPNGIFAQLGIDVLMTGGVCKGAENMVGMVNDIGLGSVSLPTLPLSGMPTSLPPVPTIPNIVFPNLSYNPPNPSVYLGSLVGTVTIPIGPWTLPTANLNSSSQMMAFNNGVNLFNSANSTMNASLGNGYSALQSGLTTLSGLTIPLPQLPVPQNLGPITCPNPNPWDNMSISLAPLDPSNYVRTNPLSSSNAFITFTDQYDNKLGSITGQNIGEFALDYFTAERVLNIAGKICGMVSPTGNLPGNALELIKEAFELYKATDKIGVSYSSGHGDYAEWLEREIHAEELGYGDIVGIRGGKIALSLQDAEQIMVVSKAPIVLGNTPDPGEEKYGNNIAFIGQVPVKVMGPVATGDYIIANPETPGYGIAVPEAELSAEQLALAVGRSWENNAAKGFKYVNTIVGMHNNGWAGPVKSLQQKVDQNKTAINILAERLENLENSTSTSASR